MSSVANSSMAGSGKATHLACPAACPGVAQVEGLVYAGLSRSGHCRAEIAI